MPVVIHIDKDFYNEFDFKDQEQIKHFVLLNASGECSIYRGVFYMVIIITLIVLAIIGVNAYAG